MCPLILLGLPIPQKKGWESWAVSIAEIDFKINGLIQTNYNKDGKIGDDSTITLHILNYVPRRMITLQAEITKNFPEFMKEDEKDLYNVILFEALTESQISDLWNKIKPNLQSEDIGLQMEIMFGSRNYPVWGGYSVGYDIVITALENNKNLIADYWTNLEAVNILRKSKYK